MTAFIEVLPSSIAWSSSSRTTLTLRSNASWSGTTATCPTPATVTVPALVVSSVPALAGAGPALPTRYAATTARATSPTTSSERTLSVTFLSITYSSGRRPILR